MYWKLIIYQVQYFKTEKSKVPFSWNMMGKHTEEYYYNIYPHKKPGLQDGTFSICIFT